MYNFTKTQKTETKHELELRAKVWQVRAIETYETAKVATNREDMHYFEHLATDYAVQASKLYQQAAATS